MTLLDRVTRGALARHEPDASGPDEKSVLERVFAAMEEDNDDAAPPHVDLAPLARIDDLGAGALRSMAAGLGIDHRAVADLRVALAQKAEDLRELIARVDGLSTAFPTLVTLKPALLAALEEHDLREVETELSCAGGASPAEVVRRLELHAALHLLRGQVSAAAAAFEMAAGKHENGAYARIAVYAPTLRNHALRYGGSGAAASLDLLRPVVTDVLRQTAPTTWAAGQTHLGAALHVKGALQEAVAAYQAALTVYTEKDHRIDWAKTQINLAGAYDLMGRAQGGEEGIELLRQATKAYRAALTVRNARVHPIDWVETQHRLATALVTMAEWTTGTEGAMFFGRATIAYRAALSDRIQTAQPERWATTQNNLGVALRRQGSWTTGAAGPELMAEAIEAYRAALKVFKRDDHPKLHALTLQNLSLAELAFAEHEHTDSRTAHLAAAKLHAEAAGTPGLTQYIEALAA